MAIASTFLPAQTDIAIIGAGPQALTLVTYLLQKRQRLRHRFLVFDPSGTWLYRWQQQFAALEIPHLRSQMPSTIPTPIPMHCDGLPSHAPGNYSHPTIYQEPNFFKIFALMSLSGGSYRNESSKLMLLGLSHYLIPFVPASACGCKQDSRLLLAELCWRLVVVNHSYLIGSTRFSQIIPKIASATGGRSICAADK
jgi:hypothetical protein